MIANASYHRDFKKPPLEAGDFLPWEKKHVETAKPQDWEEQLKILQTYATATAKPKN